MQSLTACRRAFFAAEGEALGIESFLAESDYQNLHALSSVLCSGFFKKWWKDIPLTAFDWNDTQGPAGKSYDLLGDGSIELINIPGHADGLFAVKVKNAEGKFVLLFSDGGYARKSWDQMITSGIAADKEQQKKSLAWIREQSLDENCVESLANHDPDIRPHVIEL